MRQRIADEHTLLLQCYSTVEHAELDGEDWFRLPGYPVPPGWRISDTAIEKTPIIFPVKADYPGNAPYGFLVPAGMNFGGTVPGNTGVPPKQPPFPGDWMHFSWAGENWTATGEASKGSNLLAWSRSFRKRFMEGA